MGAQSDPPVTLFTFFFCVFVGSAHHILGWLFGAGGPEALWDSKQWSGGGADLGFPCRLQALVW